MKPEHRSARQIEIETAAYELLAEKGYAGMSMLTIAKRARCSNETLYKWYGDKLGLVRAMVTRNAAGAKALLSKAENEGQTALHVLEGFGPTLLTVLLSDKAIALNRAAAADPTRELGLALATAGRETILPLVEALLERATNEGEFTCENVPQAVDLYMSLLIGDLQIRRVIGRIPPLSEQDIQERSMTALDALRKLLS